MSNRSESHRATSLQIISSTDFPQCFWIAIEVRLTQDARLPPAFLGYVDICWLESKMHLLKRLKTPPVGFWPPDNQSAPQ